ncbi:alpha/beta hydrolase [Planctomycetota bacterium]|nr:alpha/beta hydrolase [Planctomycetota bacterium]
MGVTTLLVAGERLAVRVVGDGQPAWVGIHGLGSDSRDLLPVADLVDGSALLVDLPGFGASDRPRRAYPVRRAARAVLSVLDHFGVDHAVWLGCSYGGHVALRACLDAPERVTGLVLCSSAGLDPHPPAGLAAAYEETLMRLRPSALVAAACDALVSQPNALTHAFRSRRLKAHVALSSSADYRAIARSAVGSLADDAPRRLEQVDVPVELLLGTNDPLISVAVVRAAHQRLTDSALTVLDRTGHMPWLETPEAVAARLRRLVSGVTC